MARRPCWSARAGRERYGIPVAEWPGILPAQHACRSRMGRRPSSDSSAVGGRPVSVIDLGPPSACPPPPDEQSFIISFCCAANTPRCAYGSSAPQRVAAILADRAKAARLPQRSRHRLRRLSRITGDEKRVALYPRRRASLASFLPSSPFLEFKVTISIANRILLGFAFIVALMVGLGAYTINQLDDVAPRRKRSSRGTSRYSASSMDGARARTRCAERARKRSRAFSCAPSGSSRGLAEELVAEWGRRAATTEESLNQAIATTNNYLSASVTASAPMRGGALPNSGQCKRPASPTPRHHPSVSSAPSKHNDLRQFSASQNALWTSREAWSKSLDDVSKVLREAIAIGQRRVATSTTRAAPRSSSLSALSRILSILITYLLRSSIANPLERLHGVRRTRRPRRPRRTDRGGGKDELGRLGTTLNGMVEGFDNWRGRAARRPKT